MPATDGPVQLFDKFLKITYFVQCLTSTNLDSIHPINSQVHTALQRPPGRPNNG